MSVSTLERERALMQEKKAHWRDVINSLKAQNAALQNPGMAASCTLGMMPYISLCSLAQRSSVPSYLTGHQNSRA